MVITLVGLSGSGKSHFAKRMAEEKGFIYRGVDELIIERMKKEPATAHLTQLEDVAGWLGQPFSEGFREREACYLRHEKAVMEQCLNELGTDGWGLPHDLVIDTTGSVIYLGEDLMRTVAERSRIVYLAIPETDYEFMLQQYFEDPKPVIWGEQYAPLPEEPAEQALRRCYPELLSWRSEQYAAFADMMLVMDRNNRDKLSVTRFLRLAGAQ